MNVRYKHMIITLDDQNKANNTLVFPSVNQAKRYNRTKLGGAAKIVGKRPTNAATYEQSNAWCKKED